MSVDMARRKQEHPQPLRNQMDDELTDRAILLTEGKRGVFIHFGKGLGKVIFGLYRLVNST